MGVVMWVKIQVVIGGEEMGRGCGGLLTHHLVIVMTGAGVVVGLLTLLMFGGPWGSLWNPHSRKNTPYKWWKSTP